MSDTVRGDGILRAKLRIQNVGFGNLTRKMKTSLFVYGMGSFGMLDTVGVLSYHVALPDTIDFMKVHSRKIEIKGADTVMTFLPRRRLAGNLQGIHCIRCEVKIFRCLDCHAPLRWGIFFVSYSGAEVKNFFL